jgi:hypothetical protein
LHLGKLYLNFDARCKSYSVRISTLKSKKSNIQPWEFNYQTEVLISDIWQNWCHFTRKLLFSSCRGTVARDGSTIVARAGINTWQRLGYEAKRGVMQQNATPNGHLNFLIRKEPTWGDLDCAIKIIIRLQPSNKNHLLSTFGSFSQLKDLQLVRNACAHKNVETISSIQSLASSYNFGIIKNATQVAWATVIGSNELAIDQWLFEMNLVADLATSSS